MSAVRNLPRPLLLVALLAVAAGAAVLALTLTRFGIHPAAMHYHGDPTTSPLALHFHGRLHFHG